MSYYTYHKKALLETPDHKLLFLALYSDSSLTRTTESINGRIYEYHPKNWCIISAKEGLLMDKEQRKTEVQDLITNELQRLNKCYTEFGENRIATVNDQCYSGTVYPSGGKVKDMRAFYSVRNTKDAASYLELNHFWVHCSIYDSKTYKTLESNEVYVNSLEKLYEADAMVKEMKQKSEYICLDVVGLPTGDEFK